MPVVNDYTAILGLLENEAYAWNAGMGAGTPVFVTYNVLSADQLPNVADISYGSATVEAFNNAQESRFEAALAIFETATGVRFVEVETGEAMINVHGVTGSSWNGWASYPYVSNGFTSSGSLVMDLGSANPTTDRGFQIMLHEIGHAMGLAHPHEGIYTLPSHLDTQSNTLMTYNSGRGGIWTDQLGVFDLQALTLLYGDTFKTKNWSYGFEDGVFNVVANNGKNDIVGVLGSNNLSGEKGADNIFGREGNDTLNGGGGKDLLDGGAGNDLLDGGSKKDELIGGWGDDTLIGGKGKDTLTGGDGKDTLDGGKGADHLYGDEGFWGDTFFGGGGKDRIFGGSGSDSIDGGGGSDRIEGGEGWDTIFGGAGNDSINGGSGNNTIDGGSGNDTLIAGQGDELTGGTGADVFIFTPSTQTWGSYHEITDFELGLDIIDASALSYTLADLSLLQFSGASNVEIRGFADNTVIELEGISRAELEAFGLANIFL